jgi:hypothetical protein
MPGLAGQLFALANQDRAARHLATLQWDPALAAGALRHCMRMAQDGSISHGYGGEPDVVERAAQAGARFSLIEENVASGPYASGLHQAWMNSPDHRSNLLSPRVNRVGVAVVARGNLLYAVADYTHAEPVLTLVQAEAVYAGLLRARGLRIRNDASQARAYCASSGRLTATDQPDFAIRWQDPDVSALPQDLARRVESGGYREAAVGSCQAQDVAGRFTVYRTAVLLYGADAASFEIP